MIKKGFTLIELMVIVAIIALLTVVIFVSVSQGRKNSRINSAKTALKTALPAIIACKDSGGTVNVPTTSGNDICAANVGLAGAKWPILGYGYAYAGGAYDSVSCNFQVSTNGDTASNLVCNCIRQVCE